MPLTADITNSAPIIDLGELKNHLNLEGTDRFDDLLGFLIEAAEQPAREALGQTLIAAELVWTMRDFHRVSELPRPPLQSVSKVEYRDAEGNWQTVDASNYEVNTDARPGFVRFNNEYQIPDTYRNEEFPWRFTYRAGYATDDGRSTYEQVPSEIRHWIMNRIGTAFMKRESYVVSTGSVDVVELKAQMASLIKGHTKRVRFG